MSAPIFVLAPMDGMTRAPFRSLCFDYGADGATTEMIQSLAFGRAKKKMSAAFEETLARWANEKDLAAQLIGSDPAIMAESARRLAERRRFDAIEINMGCPARKVVGSGNGSALMRETERAMAVMRAVREATDLPLRLKMRLGWDDTHITAPELALEAEKLGFQRITLHGRTRMQMYTGDVDLEAMRGVIAAVNIPVLANGGVTDAAGALRFLEQTGAAGVCIGRAALKQPWIFEDIGRLRRGEAIAPRRAPERVGVLLRLAETTCQLRPERVAICEMRKFSGWLLPGLTGAERVLAELNGIVTLGDFQRLMESFLNARLQTNDIDLHEALLPAWTLDTVHRENGMRR